MGMLRKITAAILSLALVLSTGIGFYSFYVQAAWSEAGIESEYEYMSDFTVPERNVIVNGKKAVSKAVITTPEGKVTNRNTIKLDATGMYKVTYTASVGGKAYEDEVTFVVQNGLYSFITDESSAVYGKYKRAESTEGLLIRLARGDTFTLNIPVDMASLEEDELLLQAFATPDTAGIADFEKLCFKFTDVEDPSISLYFSARQTGQDPTLPYTYCVAGGENQTPKGRETSTNKLFEEGKYGFVAMHSFGLGNPLCSEYCDSQTLGFRVDFESKEVYDSRDMKIVDLDSPEDFDTVWEGFPSGKAFLTVWADFYNEKTANFCLSKVGNVDLTQEKVIDAKGPTITINTEYEELPKAVKGGSYSYIPTASAWDLYSGKCEVTTRVCYNYQSPNQSMTQVKKGRFQTPRAGYYAIIYEATDKFGNLGREILWVESLASLKKPVITLKEEPEKTHIVGELFLPKDYTYECSSGNPTVKVYAIKGDKKYNVTDGYRFKEEGEFTIQYKITDVAGQSTTYEHELTVKVGDRPVLVDELNLPEYLIEGSEYVFPTVYFNDYRSGKEERKLATGKIADTAGESEVKAGDAVSFSVNTSGSKVKIIFICENASYEAEIPVVKAWVEENGRSRLALENYFIGKGFTYEKSDAMTFTASEADGGWMFANRLLAENFSMSLQGVPEDTDYEGLVLAMYDSQDKTRELTLELPYEKDVLSVVTNGKKQILKKNIDLATSDPITVNYKDGFLYVAGQKIKNVDFSGFPSHYLYFSIHFKGAGKASFKLLTLDNHVTDSAKSDRMEPRLAVLGDFGGSREYGSKIVLPAVFAGDVLNPNLIFSMTVMNGDKVMKDVEGTALENVDPTREYVIKADEYGKYNVVINAQDSFNEKNGTLSYVLHVIDNAEPEITFIQEKVMEGKVGDTIIIPDFTVLDNITEANDIVVRKQVFAPSGTMVVIPGNSNSVNASVPGKYKFMILATDAEGNTRNVSWTVTIAEN